VRAFIVRFAYWIVRRFFVRSHRLLEGRRSPSFAIIGQPSCVDAQDLLAAPSGHGLSYAIAFLYSTQTRVAYQGLPSLEHGSWPQCISFAARGPFVGDRSPFVVSFIYHALAVAANCHLRADDLSEESHAVIRQMRDDAVCFMRQFRSTCQGCSTAYTYGFWPYVPPKRSVLLEIPSKLLQLQGGSLRLGGSRGPVNIGFYPRAWQLPADADDTACVWAALMEHTSTESNTHSSPHLCEVFADWRDIGTDKLRSRQEWLPVGSGAYLTWMPCARQVGEHRACPDAWSPSGPKVNDVDIVVNANVLYALGTFGHRGCTGFEDAVRAVNDALDYTMQAFGRIDTSILSSYYPNNNALHYCVARAYRCGDVLDLSPSIKAITTDLINTAHWAKGGTCHWGDGDRFLDTAFACSTLLMLGYEGPEIDAGMIYLLSGQDPVTGAWPAETFCIGKFPYGDRLTWQSSALTTAMAVEAICRWKDRGLHKAG
jgi:hypothetical protein